jgi:hypothetical protein
VRLKLPKSNSIWGTFPRDIPDEPVFKGVEWAFAGTSTTTPAQGDIPAHTVWAHWIDSLWFVDDVEDDGDMYPLPNGMVLEKGFMHQVDAEIPYEELWQDLEPAKVEKGRPHFGAVLKLDNVHRDTKGMMIRIADLVQGIVIKGEDVDTVTVERWVYDATQVSLLLIVRVLYQYGYRRNGYERFEVDL